MAALFFVCRGVFHRTQACKLRASAGHKAVFWIVAAVVGIGLVLEAVEKRTGFRGEGSRGRGVRRDKHGGAEANAQSAFVGLDRKPWKLRDHRGQVLLLKFWATWCAPCRTEMPALVRLSDRYKSAGLQVVGVNMDEGGLEQVRRFVRDYSVTYPILAGGAGRVVMKSMVEKLPTTLLVDKQARLAQVPSLSI